MNIPFTGGFPQITTGFFISQYVLYKKTVLYASHLLRFTEKRRISFHKMAQMEQHGVLPFFCIEGRRWTRQEAGSFALTNSNCNLSLLRSESRNYCPANFKRMLL
jgi:hypothetical protein